jgi:hypothetical protein
MEKCSFCGGSGKINSSKDIIGKSLSVKRNKPQQVTSEELFAMSRELTSTYGLGYVGICTSSTLEGVTKIARKKMEKGFTPVVFTMGYVQDHPEYDDPNSRFRILMAKVPDTIPVEFEEDNIYKHMSIVTRNNFPYQGYKFDLQRDPFEWELNSTKYVARAIIVDSRYSFEVRCELMRFDMPNFPSEWKFLKNKNITGILKLSVNQLQSDVNFMKISPDNASLQPSSESALIKTIVKMMQSYLKLWGTNTFQILIMSTEAGRKVNFLKKLGKALTGLQNFKPMEDLAAEFMTQKSPTAATKKMFYVVLQNNYGSPIKEGDMGEETDSSAFSATPENAAVWTKGKTGEELNSDARKHLDQMFKQGLGAQLEDYKEPKKLKEGQICVLQNYNKNHIDIIDVISRESEGKLFGDTIRYKDKDYTIFRHPKVGDCIAIT